MADGMDGNISEGHFQHFGIPSLTRSLGYVFQFMHDQFRLSKPEKKPRNACYDF